MSLFYLYIYLYIFKYLYCLFDFIFLFIRPCIQKEEATNQLHRLEQAIEIPYISLLRRKTSGRVPYLRLYSCILEFLECGKSNHTKGHITLVY